MIPTTPSSTVPRVVFSDTNGFPLAHEDGMVMAVVPKGMYLDAALDVLVHEMAKHVTVEPGISGELVLDPHFAEEVNLAVWAQDNELANRRISFHVAEDAVSKVPLEHIAQERFHRYLLALYWARGVLESYISP